MSDDELRALSTPIPGKAFEPYLFALSELQRRADKRQRQIKNIALATLVITFLYFVIQLINCFRILR